MSVYSSPRARKRQRSEHDGTTNPEMGVMSEKNSRFVGSASGIHLVRAVYRILAGGSASQPKGGAEEQQHTLVPGEDDQLSPQVGASDIPLKALPFWNSQEICFSGASATAPLPTFDQLIGWTKSYFENWHPAFPFVSGDRFLDMLETLSSHGLHSLGRAEMVIVRSVVSISLADSRQSPRSDSTPVPDFLVFRDSDDVISSTSFILGSPASILHVQAAFSAQLFLASMLKLNMASRFGGMILQMALHLGLHRCPSRFRSFTKEESQLRRRIWLSIYCLERQLCQSLGLPLSIRDDDIDVCHPGQEVHAAPDGRALDIDTSEDGQLQLLGLLSKHAQVRGLILELRNKHIRTRHETFDHVVQVQAELAKWINEANEFLDEQSQLEEDQQQLGQSPQGEKGRISASHRLLLTILQHESSISLNRPLLTTATDKSAFHVALQACISASRSAINALHGFYTEWRVPDTGSLLHEPLVWPLMTWSLWMSCFILGYAALEGFTAASSVRRYVDKTLIVLRHLSLRRTIWPDSCAEAVKHLSSVLQRSHEKGDPITIPQSGNANTRSFSSNTNHEQGQPSEQQTGRTQLGVNTVQAHHQRQTLLGTTMADPETVTSFSSPSRVPTAQGSAPDPGIQSFAEMQDPALLNGYLSNFDPEQFDLFGAMDMSIFANSSIQDSNTFEAGTERLFPRYMDNN